MGGMPTLDQKGVMLQVEKFKHLGFLFVNDGRMDHVIEKRSSDCKAVDTHGFVLVKRDLNWKMRVLFTVHQCSARPCRE